MTISQINLYCELSDILTNLALDSCQRKIVGLGAGGYTEEITARNWFQTVQRSSKLLIEEGISTKTALK